MMPGNARDELNYGGKIILPPSSLNKLTRLHITYPMLFELESEETGMITHGGVLEFIAQEGLVYLPQWMMDSLAVAPGSLLKVTNTSLDLGKFVKIEPQSTDFLEISDPKAVLENALRNYSTLTKDDVFQISYNDKIYSIKILEVKPESPSHSISVIETDLEVDFAPPVGYVEPPPVSRPGSVISTGSKANNSGSATPTPLGQMAKSINYEEILRKELARSKINSFHGSGHKLAAGRSLGGGGKSTSGTSLSSSNTNSDSFDRKGKGISGKTKQREQEQQKQQQDDEISAKILSELPAVDAGPLNLPFGQLFFGFPIVPLKNVEQEEKLESENAAGATHEFSGSGQSLRKSRKRKTQTQQASSSPAKKLSPSPPEVIEID